MKIGMPRERPTIRGRLLVLGSTPLLTIEVEVTGNPPRLELVRPEESEAVEETTDYDETVGGVAKPSKETEPNLNDLKVIRSVLVLLIPMRVSN
jgi:hypothetical protein